MIVGRWVRKLMLQRGGRRIWKKITIFLWQLFPGTTPKFHVSYTETLRNSSGLVCIDIKETENLTGWSLHLKNKWKNIFNSPKVYNIRRKQGWGQIKKAGIKWEVKKESQWRNCKSNLQKQIKRMRGLECYWSQGKRELRERKHSQNFQMLQMSIKPLIVYKYQDIDGLWKQNFRGENEKTK